MLQTMGRARQIVLGHQHHIRITVTVDIGDGNVLVIAHHLRQARAVIGESSGPIVDQDERRFELAGDHDIEVAIPIDVDHGRLHAAPGEDAARQHARLRAHETERRAGRWRRRRHRRVDRARPGTAQRHEQHDETPMPRGATPRGIPGEHDGHDHLL